MSRAREPREVPLITFSRCEKKKKSDIIRTGSHCQCSIPAMALTLRSTRQSERSRGTRQCPTLSPLAGYFSYSSSGVILYKFSPTGSKVKDIPADSRTITELLQLDCRWRRDSPNLPTIGRNSDGLRQYHSHKCKAELPAVLGWRD